MKYFAALLLVLFACKVQSQIKGTITDTKLQPLPYVNVYIENTYKGTTSNEAGYFELAIQHPGKITVVFQSLGYKTQKKELEVTQFPYELNVVLIEETISLDEVVIDSEVNPADAILRQTIAARKASLERIKSYKADYYSRGLIRIKDAPERILGQEVGDFDGSLDSTRSGILYLSETISKLEYLYPNKLKETITASKVSGDDNGFSFNNANDVNFNFYNNTLSFGSEMISPIADNAFNYYRYKLEGIFYDENGYLINKIKVIPKRPNDPVFTGTIFIVEDQWTLYALKLSLNGTQARIPVADQITLEQNFAFSFEDTIWAMRSQSIDFSYGFMGFKGDGRFTAVFSNYEFNAGFENKKFGRELVAFEPESNKKDSLFWNQIRPVPLTSEEQKDYLKKDSLQLLRKSKPYLDSIDREKNKFKITNVLSGYNYQNSHKHIYMGYDIPLSGLQFNTVQGYTLQSDLYFRKNYDEFRHYFSANGSLQYGFSDKRLRASLRLSYKFNDINDAFLSLSGGNQMLQYNNSNPISPFINSLSTLLFEDNYAKFYERNFVQLSYSQEVINGFRPAITLNYQQRNPVFITTDQVFFNDENDAYTSNNPLDPNAFGVAPFLSHNIFKAFLSARFNFGQNYLSYPNSKFNINNEDYPTLVLAYEKGFGASNSDYNFNQIKAQLYQSFTLGNKGRMAYNINAGKFFNAEDIAFIDYQHFNGNQTHVSMGGSYTNVFNNLDYYTHSTNDAYFEGHLEHDFNGFILGKIPLINKLNFNLIAGAHLLAIPNLKPYQEFTIGLDNIGFGKWRFLRLDYVRSYQSGFQSDALVFGLKFF